MFFRRLLYLSLAGIVLLDIGRSLCARSAAMTPEESFQSPHAIAWPPGVDLPPEAPLGERVYARHCAVCHGPDGKGDGPAAPSLMPPPRDFSRGTFKYKSSAGSEPPRAEDLRRSIRHGVAGTSMPAWDDLLSGEDIDAVIDVVRRFGPLEAWTQPAEPAGNSNVVFAAADAERGKQRYAALGCPACHGPEGRGDGPSAPDLRDVWKHPVAARDLTAPWTYRWGTERNVVYRWIAGGMSGTPMPGYLEVTEPEEIADVVVYLESIARRPPWETGTGFEGDEDPRRRGEYLVRTGMCALCHTPVDAAGIYQSSTHDLAGGMKIDAGAHGVFFATNLTADEETGLGAWSEAQIAAAIQTGHTRAGRLNYWAMPWQIYGNLAPADAMAIATYLKALPPVHNAVPDPLHYGSIETVARKLMSAWPAVPPRRLSYASGNYGSEGAPPDLGSTQRRLIQGQRFLIVLAVLCWLLSGKRGGDESRHGGASMTAGLLVFVAAAGVAFVERYPAIGPLPAAPMIAGFAEGIPALPAEDAGQILRQRGRYLFAVSSCAFCHGGDGAGGTKVNWRGFGTAWASNLTPAALAEWSDDDILRALRSGVRPDGRQMHWQAMTWDFFSNYREEDLRSLLAYIRGLAAAGNESRAALPPGDDDCADYTVWTSESDDRGGCR